MKWFKLWNDILSDPKIMLAPPVTRWAWVGVLVLASERDNGGKLEAAPGVPLGDKEIALLIRVSDGEWAEAKAHFLKRGMLCVDGEAYVVKNYVKRQASPDKTGAERQARYRERSEGGREAKAGAPREELCRTTSI